MNKHKSAKDTDLESYSENFCHTVQAIKGALTEEQIESLTNLKNSKEVFVFLWNLQSTHDIYSLEEEYNAKCATSAKEFRDKGNEYFKKKSYLTAIGEYNQCIFKAPHPEKLPESSVKNVPECSDESNTCSNELSLAYGNRSACLVHMERWGEAITDINEALHLGVPLTSKHKLLHRIGVCCLKLGNVHEAKSNFNLALDHLQHLEDDKSKSAWNKTLQKCLVECSSFENAPKKLEPTTTPSSTTLPNHLFLLPELSSDPMPSHPECSDALHFEVDKQGASLVRAENMVEVGDVVIIEKPFSSVLFADRQDKQRCYHCFKPIHLTPTSCFNCSTIAYCSPLCRSISYKTHRVECRFFFLFGQNMCADVGHLAVKMILQVGVRKALEMIKEVKKIKGGGGDGGKTVKSDDNETTKSECDNEEKELLKSYTEMLKLKVLKWEWLRKDDGPITTDLVYNFLKLPMFACFLLKVLFVCGHVGLSGGGGDDVVVVNKADTKKTHSEDVAKNENVDTTNLQKETGKPACDESETIKNEIESESTKKEQKTVKFQEEVCAEKTDEQKDEKKDDRNILSFMQEGRKEVYLSMEEAMNLGELLLLHLRIIRRHCRPIRESGRFGDDDTANSLNIGAGMYPRGVVKVAPSCDPTADVVFYNDMAVVRAIRQVYKGEDVTVSFGPLFHQTSFKLRRRALFDNHAFSCSCEACLCKWPIMQEMFIEAPIYRCQGCRRLIESNSQTEGSRLIVCCHCNFTQNLEEIVTKLQTSYDDYALSMNEAMCGNHTKAVAGFTRHLRLLQSHIFQPWPDFIATQAAVKACLRLLGNVKKF